MVRVYASALGGVFMKDLSNKLMHSYNYYEIHILINFFINTKSKKVRHFPL